MDVHLVSDGGYAGRIACLLCNFGVAALQAATLFLIAAVVFVRSQIKLGSRYHAPS